MKNNQLLIAIGNKGGGDPVCLDYCVDPWEPQMCWCRWLCGVENKDPALVHSKHSSSFISLAGKVGFKLHLE